MNKFIFIVGVIASGKTTFIEKQLYNQIENQFNFFDQGRKKLMIQMYTEDNSKVNDLYLSNAFKNAVNDSLTNHKDFMMQIHFTNEQLSQINTYFEQYKSKFEFNAHFIGVSELSILKERAIKRGQLGGDYSEEKSIEKSFAQSLKNFIAYIPKFEKVTVWDNTKEYGFKDMEEQLIFERGKLIFENPNLTSYSNKILNLITKPCKK